MCPVCIASAAVTAAGASSTAVLLAVCIGKFSQFVKANGLGRLQRIKER
jgi:hypothetical protein